MSGSPFPGMDPYLEVRDLWPDVHSTLISRMRARISAQLPEPYFARIDERIVLWPADDDPPETAARPDITVAAPEPQAPSRSSRQPVAGCVLVRTVIPEQQVEHHIRIHRRDHAEPVAAIELLSYSNKLAGEDRDRYLSMRGKLLTSPCHLVEIDLLRAGRRMPMEDPMPAGDYVILVSPARMRPTCEVWSFGVREPIPTVVVPLRGQERVALDVGAALAEAYAQARYERTIDYRVPPRPRFGGADADWVAATASPA